MRTVLTVLITGLVCSACFQRDTPARESLAARAARQKPYVCEEHVPPKSSGPKPAGTRQDPFVGYAVVRRITDHSPELVRILVRQRAIAYFRNGVEMWMFVRREMAAGVADGDFVKLKYARYALDSEMGQRYTAAEAARVPVVLPFAYCGHELFEIEVVQDDLFPR